MNLCMKPEAAHERFACIVWVPSVVKGLQDSKNLCHGLLECADTTLGKLSQGWMTRVCFFVIIT